MGTQYGLILARYNFQDFMEMEKKMNILNCERNIAQKNTILNSPYIYTMKLSIFIMIKFWCSGNLLLLNFL